MASTLIRLCKPLFGRPKTEAHPAFTKLSDEKQIEAITAHLHALHDLRREAERRKKARETFEDHAQASGHLKLKV